MQKKSALETGRPSLSNAATPIRAIKRGEYMECMIVPVSLKMHTPSEAGGGGGDGGRKVRLSYSLVGCFC